MSNDILLVLIWSLITKFDHLFVYSDMDETRIIVTHGGQWIGYKYEGGESEIAFVSTNATLDDLKKTVENIVGVDITKSTFNVHILVETFGRLVFFPQFHPTTNSTTNPFTVSTPTTIPKTNPTTNPITKPTIHPINKPTTTSKFCSISFSIQVCFVKQRSSNP